VLSFPSLILSFSKSFFFYFLAAKDEKKSVKLKNSTEDSKGCTSLGLQILRRIEVEEFGPKKEKADEAVKRSLKTDPPPVLPKPQRPKLTKGFSIEKQIYGCRTSASSLSEDNDQGVKQGRKAEFQKRVQTIEKSLSLQLPSDFVCSPEVSPQTELDEILQQLDRMADDARWVMHALLCLLDHTQYW
jgi:hypothetical protein